MYKCLRRVPSSPRAADSCRLMAFFRHSFTARRPPGDGGFTGSTWSIRTSWEVVATARLLVATVEGEGRLPRSRGGGTEGWKAPASQSGRRASTSRDRERDPDGRAFAGGADNGEATPVAFGHRAGDGQPETVAPPRAPTLDKGGCDVGKVLRSDARPSVAHLHGGAGSLSPAGQDHGRGGGREPHGVLRHSGEHVGHLRGIPGDRDAVGLRHERDTLEPGGGLQVGGHP